MPFNRFRGSRRHENSGRPESRVVDLRCDDDSRRSRHVDDASGKVDDGAEEVAAVGEHLTEGEPGASCRDGRLLVEAPHEVDGDLRRLIDFVGHEHDLVADHLHDVATTLGHPVVDDALRSGR